MSGKSKRWTNLHAIDAACCPDSARRPHGANLYDISKKYADVTDINDIERWLIHDELHLLEKFRQVFLVLH